MTAFRGPIDTSPQSDPAVFSLNAPGGTRVVLAVP